MVPAATAAVFVVFFIMAWSPFRRSNAGISWGEHPGDYANRISTTPATGPQVLQIILVIQYVVFQYQSKPSIYIRH